MRNKIPNPLHDNLSALILRFWAATFQKFFNKYFVCASKFLFRLARKILKFRYENYRVRGFIVFGLVLGGAAMITTFAHASNHPPYTPDTFTQSAVSACTIYLKWHQNLGDGNHDSAVGFNGQRSTQPGFGTKTDLDFSNGVNSLPNGYYEYNNINLNPNSGSYYYRIRSYDGDLPTPQNSGWNTGQSMSTLSLNNSLAISALFTQEIVGSNGGEIELYWTSNAPSLYGGFQLWREDSTDGINFNNLTMVDANSDGIMYNNSPTPDVDNDGDIDDADDRLLYNMIFFRDGASPALDSTKAYRYKLRSFESDLGCLPTVAIFSSFSSYLIVPSRPLNLRSDYLFDPNNPLVNGQINLNWDDGKGETRYEIWRKEDNSNYGVSPYATVSTNAYSDTSLVTQKTYTYKIRACNGTDNFIGCSAFSTETSERVASAPENLSTKIVYANYIDSPQSASVYLQWDNTFSDYDYEIHRIYRATDDVIEPGLSGSNFPNGKVSYTDASAPLVQNVVYRVRAIIGTGYSGYSNDSVVNLNIYRILRGSAWAMASSDNGQHGIGWVSFNKADLDDACDPNKHVGESPPWVQPTWCTKNPDGSNGGWLNQANQIYYSVQIDNQGFLSGAGWASAHDENGETVGWGWLSFNKGDLAGCPDGTNVDCAAEIINPVKDAAGNITSCVDDKCDIRGWGRFIGAADDNNSEWDGWVSLSDTAISGSAPRTALLRNKNIQNLANSWKDLKKSFNPKNFSLANLWDNAKSFAESFSKVVKVLADTSAPYNIFYQPLSKKVSGAGWGGAIVGWVAMNNDTGNSSAPCPQCDVRSVNRGPNVTDVQIKEGDIYGSAKAGDSIWCALEPSYKVYFHYSDFDNNRPEEVKFSVYDDTKHLIFDTTANFTSGNVTCDSSDYISGAICNVVIRDPLGYITSGLYTSYLIPNTSYYVKLKAADGPSAENETLWSNNNTMASSEDSNSHQTVTTPPHYYPFVWYSWAPDVPQVGQIVKFTDKTNTNQGGSHLNGRGVENAWLWTFTNGNTTDPTIKDPEVIFHQLSAGQEWKATSRVTDTDGHQCHLDWSLTGTGGGGNETLKRRIFRER